MCIGEVCGIGCGGVYVGEMCECGVVYVWGCIVYGSDHRGLEGEKRN